MGESQMDWVGEAEMQRLLDMLPVQPEGMSMVELDEDVLGMELSDWEYAAAIGSMTLPTSVNVI